MLRSTPSRSTVATGVSSELTSKPDHGVALDVETDEIGLDRRPRRHRVGEEPPVLGVHLVEVRQVAEVHADPHGVLQRPAGRTRDSIEIPQHLANLLRDGRAGAIAGGVVRTLAGEKEELADCDSLRVAAGRRWRFL